MSAGEMAYVYAKSCGIIAKSFVESRISRLAPLKSVAELEELLFASGGSVPLTGSGTEIENIEKKIIDRMNKSIHSIVSAFRHPNEILVLLANGLGTEAADSADNRAHYKMLIAAVAKTPRREIEATRFILGEELSLLNCSIALRMRSYYAMKGSEIESHLIKGKLGKNERALEADALSSLEFDKTHITDWSSWRRKSFLNSDAGGKYWKCDPRHFQNTVRVYLYNLARKNLRRRPFTADTACCLILLKQFEAELLTGVLEGLKLKMDGETTLKSLGLHTAGAAL
jgi:hypothetical protein